MGSREGARKGAARRHGMTPEEYAARITREKWCTACKAWHPRAAFGSDQSRDDGLASSCKASRERTDAPTKRERAAMAKLGLSWCRDCKWWVAIADVRAGLCRAHRNADYRRRYAEDGRAIRARVYARKRSIDPLPVEAAELLIETTGGLCGYGCDSAATTFDHVIPVSKGGRTERGNIIPACGSCNSSKSNRDPLPWIARMADEAIDLIMPTLTHDGPILELLVSE